MKSIKISKNISIILTLFVISINGLHCHRKHDHSSDILLQSDQIVSSHEKYLHGGVAGAKTMAKSTSSDLFYSARLVQQPQQPQEPDFEAKRDVSPSQESTSAAAAEYPMFCPDLTNCTCNFTSNTNHPRLQVIHVLLTLYKDLLRRLVA